MNADIAKTLRGIDGMILKLQRLACRLERSANAVDRRRSVLNEDEANIIKQAVADYFQIHSNLFSIRIRTRRVAWPRQIAMRLVYEVLGFTLEDTAYVFGNRDHGTVLHGIGVVKDRVATEVSARMDYDTCRAKVLKALQEHRNA